MYFPRLHSLLFLVAVIASTFTACAPTAPINRSTGVTHADLLRITPTDSFTRVDVLDAWHKGRTQAIYLLVPQTQALPHDLPSGTIVRTPLRRAVVASSVHAALLYDLGVATSIAGICDTAYIISPTLRQALQAGRLASAGLSTAVDAERLVSLHADAFLTAPIDGRLQSPADAAGVVSIACPDYMETSALGRAEWMKFFGLLFDRKNVADSIFATITTAYDSLKTAVSRASFHPRLMVEMKVNDTWYVPGGNSYLGRLYTDAGATYAFADNKESGSVAMDVETVLTHCERSDVWLIKYAMPTTLTYATMKSNDGLYTRFAPWQHRRIWGCNTLTVPYYEETPFRPDRLLRDLIHIFHPEVLPGYHSTYFTPLQ